jgi:hypothetical protein
VARIGITDIRVSVNPELSFSLYRPTGIKDQKHDQDKKVAGYDRKYYVTIKTPNRSRDSSVGIATGYELDGRSSILGRSKRFFSFPHRPDRR